MGYSTSFNGKINFDRVLTVSELRELEALANYSLQDEEFKKYADSWPQSYLQWSPTEDGQSLEWNGAEKFYDYVEWLEWLMDYYFTPKGIQCNGEMVWQGEEIGDIGKITVDNNVVKSQELKLPPNVCPHCGEKIDE